MTSPPPSCCLLFPHTPRRDPSEGYAQTPQQRQSDAPWECFVAESLAGKSSECLLCGRVSARNLWRTRAHFLGGDAHVQLCPQLTREVTDFLDLHGAALLADSKRKSASSSSSPQQQLHISPAARSSSASPPGGGRSSSSSSGKQQQQRGMPQLVLDAAVPAPHPLPAATRCVPKPGFEPDLSPEPHNAWRANLAFNKHEAKAQCLLCNRVSKNNTARLKAHFLGGDKHVAVCPFVSRAAGIDEAAAAEDDRPAAKRERLADQGLLLWLLAAADLVESEEDEAGVVVVD